MALNMKLKSLVLALIIKDKLLALDLDSETHPRYTITASYTLFVDYTQTGLF